MEYRRLYDELRLILKDSGVAEADLDSRLIMEYVCTTNRNTLLAHPDREVSEAEESTIRDMIAKRANRIPLQHITGHQEFMGLDFVVSEDVLIPRQDTEILVEEAMIETMDGMSVLDMCTGSGCILLSIMRYKNEIDGTGVDKSDKALNIARENAKALGIDCKFIESNLFEGVEGQFDVIVSNPPYIATEVIKTLETEVKDHEPIMALDGKEDGLYFYREITKEAVPHLFGGGKLLYEIGYDQGEAVSEIMIENGFKDVRIVKDYAGFDRVVVGHL